MKNCEAIFLEAGHWLNNYWQNDNGAISDWLVERELTKQIVNELYNKLVKKNIYIECIWEEQDLSLNSKIWIINNICEDEWYNSNNSILLSIHINAWWWEWIETFTYKDWKDWLWYWNKILLNLSETTWMKIRWAKYEDESQYNQLAIVHNTEPLAILVECWFIDNSKDRLVLLNDIDLIVNWLYDWLAEICWFEKLNKTISYKEMYENEKRNNEILEEKLYKINILSKN